MSARRCTVWPFATRYGMEGQAVTGAETCRAGHIAVMPISRRAVRTGCPRGPPVRGVGTGAWGRQREASGQPGAAMPTPWPNRPCPVGPASRAASPFVPALRPVMRASREGQPFGRVTPYESHSMSPAGRVTPRGAIQCGASMSGGGTPAPRPTAGAFVPGRPRQTMIMPPGSGPEAPGIPVAPPAPPALPEATAGSASSRPFQWMTCARKAFTALSKAG